VVHTGEFSLSNIIQIITEAMAKRVKLTTTGQSFVDLGCGKGGWREMLLAS
jgi:23S rRNA U2552 (ribose-2'-O)-methylase RlmE/FtsJ